MLAVGASAGAAETFLDDADLARRAAAGDGDAFGLLFERWFDRTYDVAWHIVHNRDTAAEVAQEAFATAWQRIGTLREPESFGGWLLRIARNKGLNRLQREGRSDPVGDEESLVSLDGRAGSPDPADPVADRERDDMVWVASAALGEDDASLLNLHLRFGLDPAELASELGVEPNAVHQRLYRLKHRLGEAIGAWVLWRRGGPSCETLLAALASAQAAGFDRATASTILGHARGCESCTESRRLSLSPEALFSATPLVAAGPFLRTKTVAALEGMGVPATGPSGSSARSGSRSRSRSKARRPHSSRRVLAMGALAASVVAVAVVGVAERAGNGPSSGPLEEATASSSPSPGVGTGTKDRPPASGSKTTTVPPETAGPPVTEAPDPDPEVPGVTTTVTEPPPGPGPTIGGFRASRGTQACSTPSAVAVVFVWSSTDATSGLLGPSGGLATAVPPSGSTEACSAPGTEWTLVVTGPNGRASQRATVPSA